MNDFNSLMLYIISFSVACFFMYLSQRNKENKNKLYVFFLIVSFLIPLIISGLRYAVGTDYFNYIWAYDLTSNISFRDFVESKNIEWGFFLIRKIAGLFNNYSIMFWISSFITLLFFYLAIIDNEIKTSPALCLMIYLFVFFPSSFNIVRQHIALAIILYAYKYIFERKFIRYLIFCILASSFHTTALVMIPFYFVFFKGNNSKCLDDKKENFLLVLIIILSIICAVNFGSILNILSRIDTFSRFGMYAMEENIGANKEFFLKCIILIMVLGFRKKLINYDNRNKLYIFLLIIDLIISFIGFSNPFVKRIGLYFGITEVFLLPSIIKVLNNKLEKHIFSLGIVLYSIIFFILAFYILKQSNIIPYNIKF